MHIPAALPIFDSMSALGDTTRSRLLLLLERHELTVNELKSILQLPQSTVSRHLKVLGDYGWVTSRTHGTSRRYRMSQNLEPAAKRLWNLVKDQVLETNAASHDAHRSQAVLLNRRTRSQRFFTSAAAKWDRLRQELFGPRADLLGLLALLDETWTVTDLGCGTGAVSEALAPFVRRVIAVDDSSAMLSSARKRLATHGNVAVEQGSLESLPIPDASVDAVLLLLVMHYIVDPAVVMTEIRRILRPGGRVLIVDMLPHDREDLIHGMGQVWAGFSESQIRSLLEPVGFESLRYRRLAVEPNAKGPALFAATARIAVASADGQHGAADGHAQLALSA